MKFEHTPGPWQQIIYEHGGSRIYREKERGERILVADTYHLGDSRLFYVAPEMLEALIKVYDNRGEEDKLYLQAERLRPIIEDATGKTWEELTNCTS